VQCLDDSVHAALQEMFMVEKTAPTPEAKPAQPRRRSGINNKDRLLRQGMKDFYDIGFHGVTVDTVLSHANVPKGSFYHHFGSKETFAHRVLDEYTTWQMAQLESWSSRTDLSIPDRLSGYYLELVDGFVQSSFRRGCLAGKFSSEMAAGTPAMRHRLRASLDDWHDRIEALIAEGQRTGDVQTSTSARELSDATLALIQGAFVVGLSTRNEDAMRGIGETIRSMLRS
jgi:TetR/AcrR family transcriptional regulator, transcriptional repressor for nem operon